MSWLPILLIVPIIGLCSLPLTHRKFRHTTLAAACWWWVVAALVMSAAVIVSMGNRSGIADQLWYLAAVLGLCPFVSALGARRPGRGAWVFFVTIPMLLVLEWPAISLMVTSDINEPLVLQTPAVVGAFLVLLMGAGNYLGTRFTLAVILFCAAEICIVLSVCDLRPGSMTPVDLRIAGCVPLLLSIFAAAHSFSRWNSSELGIECVWADFRDSFGLVWSRRVAERFNLMAKRDKLETRIRSDGVIIERKTRESEELNQADRSSKAISPTATGQSREEQILRWILKRFVDEPWLNHRLSSSIGKVVQNSSPDNKRPVDVHNSRSI